MQFYHQMIQRAIWQQRIETAWQERSIIWLTGVRRVGKTTLARSLSNDRYFDCELPRTRRPIDEDPEGFLNSIGESRIILDEVHRLRNPTELLKIAADHYPNIKVVATGSSTLGASSRFRDTLTGRKRHVHLSPVLFREMDAFSPENLCKRLHFGGLPENLLSSHFPEKDYAEWMDSFWARDIQELFRLEKRQTFLRLLEILLVQSGGLCELNNLTSSCGASRQTLANYLKVLEATGAVHVVRPFSSNPQREIISMPKVYGFDTGFVCFARGWRELRTEDLGLLWEHMILDELKFQYSPNSIFHWRDKQKHEVDFVIARPNHPLIAIESKWKLNSASTRNFNSLLTLYPDARLVIIATDANQPIKHSHLPVVETGLAHLAKAVDLASAH